MIRRTRAVAALAIGAALLLNLALPRPTAEPKGVAHVLPSPQATPMGVLDRDPVNRVPPFVTWPLPEGWIGGGARPAELAPLSEAEAAAFQAAADRARAEFKLDAVAIGVSIHGQRGWAGASGTGQDGVTKLDGNSPFAIASITKTFVAATVLQLVEERRLSLSSDVSKLLPELALPSGVTVRQLLRHTSGLADLLAPIREHMNEDLERVWSGSEVMAAIGDPWFAPGTSWGYSNTNYVVLGLLVERVTGRPFVSELSRRLLAPLGMDGTGMLLQPGAPFLMSPAWASAFGTSGAMYSSAYDMLRWGDALYSGHVLLPSSRSRMLSVDDHEYGLGMQQIKVGKVTGYGHSGLLRGFTSVLVHLPRQDITLVVMGTTQGFDPARLLAHADKGKPSILNLALEAGRAGD